MPPRGRGRYTPPTPGPGLPEDGFVENAISAFLRAAAAKGLPGLAARLPAGWEATLRGLVAGRNYGPAVRRGLQLLSLFARDDEPRDLIAGIGEGLGTVLTGLAADATPEQVAAAVNGHLEGGGKAQLEEFVRAAKKAQDAQSETVDFLTAFSRLPERYQFLLTDYLGRLRSHLGAAYSTEGKRYTTAILVGIATYVENIDEADEATVHATCRELFTAPKGKVENAASEAEKAIAKVQKMLDKLFVAKANEPTREDQILVAASRANHRRFDPDAMSRELHGSPPSLWQQLKNWLNS